MAKRKRRAGQSLDRVLGVPALFSTAYGNVGSSIYYALGVVALYALGLTPLVFILTGALFVMTAWSYAEATAAMPEAGGSSSFARRAFNELASFGAGWALMLDYIITIAISAFFVPHYLAVFWPILKVWPYNTIGGLVTIAVLVTVNVLGVKEAARLNIVLALLDLVTQVLLMVLGVVLLLAPKLLIDQIDLGVAPTWSQFVYGLSIGTIAYTGIETISNMAEEAAEPERTVPRAVNFVLAAVLVVYAGMSLVALSAMPVGHNRLPYDPTTHKTVAVPVVPQEAGEEAGPFVLAADRSQLVYVPVVRQRDGTYVIPAGKATGPVYEDRGLHFTDRYGTLLGSVYLEDPVQGIVTYLPPDVAWLRSILKPWVGILAATILIIATNAGLIGVSRLAYSMSLHRQLPPLLGRVHVKRLTPYVAIVVFGSVAAVLILPGSTGLLADLYAFGAMISFTMAHASVVALRIKEPDLERPFRAPLNLRFAGRTLPLTALVGGLGTFAVWVVVVSTHPMGRIIGFAWMAVGFVVYFVYRLRNGYPVLRSVRHVALPALVGDDIIYDQILVPLEDSRIADEMMVLAGQLAAENRSSIDALFVIEVPMNLPLDAPLERERARADDLLARAIAIGDQFGVKVHPHVTTARQAGRAIVDAATERRSEVIIIGSARKRRPGRTFGRTVDYVIEHAPMEVIHNIVPVDYPEHSDDPGAAVDDRDPPADGQGPATDD